MAKKKAPSSVETASTNIDRINYLLGSWRPYALLVLLGLIVYGRSVMFGFVYFDEDSLILNNFKQLSGLQNIISLFVTPCFTYFRPVLMLSFMFDVQISQTLPWMFHVSNLVYHFVACGILFYLLTYMQYPRRLSFLLSGAFLVHPLLTQAVAWVPGRNDSLLTVFILSAFIFFLKYIDTKSFKYLVSLVVFFFFSLFTKETALVFPFFCFAYWYVHDKDVFKNKPARILIANWFLVIGIWFVLRKIALTGVRAEEEYSLRAFIINAPVFLEIIGKMILPIRQSPYVTLTGISTIVGAVVVSIALILIIVMYKKLSLRTWLYIGWVLLFLLPSTAILIDGYDYRFRYLEHRAYLPLVGIILLIAELALHLNKEKIVKILYPALSVIIVVFGIRTYMYKEIFSERVLFWNTAIELAPECPATHAGLGWVYTDEKSYEKAIQPIQTAIRMNPRVATFHDMLGCAYGFLNQDDLAIQEFKTTIALDSTAAVGYANLGQLYLTKKDSVLAEKYYKTAERIDRKYSESLTKLMYLYYAQKRYDEALVYARKLESVGVLIDKNVLFRIIMRE